MIKYIITLIFFFSTFAYSEVVKKIEVTGNKRVSEQTIQVYGGISVNSDYSNFDLDEILKNLYSTDFFSDVKVILKNGLLKVNVKEYPVINSIEIKGEKAQKVKDFIFEKMELKDKGSFIKSILSSDVNNIKSLYSQMGFNFIEIEPKIEKFSEERVNLILFIKKGVKTNISKIYFIGDKKVKDRRLRDIIVSEEYKFWKFLSKNTKYNNSNIKLDTRLLTNYYKSIGYYDVQIVSTNAQITENNLTTLTYNINAGIRYKVSKISTNVSDVLDKQVFTSLEKSFNKVIGKYYSPFAVKKLLEELDNLILSYDLQFIEHDVNEVVNNDNIEIKINIYEGSKQLVERINILGNTVTNESVIRSELLLDEGDPYNILKLNKSISRLKARRIFGKVIKKIKEGETKDQKIIDITVEEKPTGEISAGAGIGTNGGSLAFSISENNWLGKGVRLSTDANLSKETFTGGISVYDPNYNFTSNALKYGAQITTNDKPKSGYKNKLYSSNLGTNFEQYNGVFVEPQIIFTYDDLQVTEDASAALSNQKGTFTDLALDYSIQKDNRDKAYMPTSGYVSTFGQTLPLYADSAYIKNMYTYAGYKLLTPNVIGSIKFRGKTINGLNDKDVRISKRVNIFSNRLRGFKAGQVGPLDGKDYVGGNYATALNFEASLPNLLPEATKTDVGLFLDFANIWGVDYSDDVDDSNKIRSSIGANVGWLSPAGPVSFVFSQNISKAASDVTESFNFRLGTTF